MLDSLNKIDRFQRSIDKWIGPSPEQRRAKASDPTRADSLAIALTDWARPLLEPIRYKCLWGGRGSGKSTAFADSLLIDGLRSPLRILCCREFQNSIADSVHYLLVERIAALALDDFYTVQRDKIFGKNGTTFVFKGIRRNIQSIKGWQGVDRCWVEEGQSISAESWRILVPTIRKPGSEIWVAFNPDQPTDIVYSELVEGDRPNCYVRRVNWDLNPHFPHELEEERLHMLRTDPDAYQHIWEGGFWVKSDAQILRGKWVVESFSPQADWDGPYIGADFGFSNDPTTLTQSWIHDRQLYVERESYQVGLELDATPARWLIDVPGCDRHIIKADSARPESISYLRRYGIPRIQPAKKYAGSVEDGIAFLRSFDRIVIHPRCTHTIEEARLYRYKTDPHSGAVLRQPIDANNHLIDGIRYSLDDLLSKARASAPITGGKMEKPKF